MIDKQETRINKMDADEIYTMGFNYECGYGVEQDYEKAIELYTKAILLDHIPALWSLINMYKNQNKYYEIIELAIRIKKIRGYRNLEDNLNKITDITEINKIYELMKNNEEIIEYFPKKWQIEYKKYINK